MKELIGQPLHTMKAEDLKASSVAVNRAEIIAATKAASTRRQRGSSLVEYSLLVSLIAIVAVAAVRSLGTVVSNQFVRTQRAVLGTGNIGNDGL